MFYFFGKIGNTVGLSLWPVGLSKRAGQSIGQGSWGSFQVWEGGTCLRDEGGMGLCMGGGAPAFTHWLH